MSDDNDADDVKPSSDLKLYETALKRFKLASDSDSQQRVRERDDLRFQVPEYQWTPQARAERDGNDALGIPPRPMLSIPKLDQPIRLVTNQARNAKLGVQIKPKSPSSTDKTAEVLQDLYRTIETNSNANIARLWAFDRAVKCGRGWYKVNTCYDHNAPEEGPEAFDQDIVIERILHQDAIYVDPAATKADFRDAEYLFVESWVPVSRFKALYPDATASESDDFSAGVFPEPEWIQGDGEAAAVRVVEYWYKVHSYKEVEYEQPDGEVLTRRKDVVTVYVAKINGQEVIEGPDEWNGRFFPFVPVIGRELQPFDSRRRWDGIIGPNKDAQRAFNYLASNGIELVGLEPKAPWIAYPEQIAGFENMWKQSNIRNYPVLFHKAYKPDGQTLAPRPERTQVDQSRLGPTMVMLGQSNEFLQSGTSQYDPSLGRTNGNEKSGRAIQSLQAQGDTATSDFLASLADLSLQLEADIILDLIPSIYDRKGRIVRLLDDQEKVKAVMINKPYRKQGEELVALEAMEQGAQFFDLSKGRYAVTVSVGKSRQSKMDATAEELGQILSSRPEMMPIIGPDYFRHRDFAGAQQIADILLKLRDHQYPFLRDEDMEGMTLEQAMARATAAEQALQQAQQAIAQLKQAQEVDAAKQQATIQKAQIDNAGKVQQEMIRGEVDKQLAVIQGQIDMALERLKGQQQDVQGDKDVHRDVTRAVVEQAVKPPEVFAGSVGKPLKADSGEV